MDIEYCSLLLVIGIGLFWIAFELDR